jgi:hypothetical protein
LKVMHIVHHIEARELRFRLPLSQSRLAELLIERVDGFASQLRSEGFPLVDVVGGEKSTASLVTKLLVKKEHHAAAIHDRVRFRFVLLPQGLYQAHASFAHDYAYARSAEVIHGPVMQALVWARVPGDVVFAVGVFAFAAFVARAFAATRAARGATETPQRAPA